MHRLKWYSFIFLAVAAVACSPEEKAPENEAVAIINEAIAAHGGELYDHSEVTFRFRDREYVGRKNQGMFQYERIFEDSAGTYRDVLNNDGYYRELNGEKVDVVDSMAAKYARSVNSVIYFAMLPDALDDEAVIAEYLGKKEIKGSTYDKIRVTFRQDGGGKDYEDIFYYWFEENSRDMDYIAYLYYTDGGGIRFREAYNQRIVNGIKFYDFINYMPEDTLDLENIDQAYLNGELEELSRIELENIEVTPL